MTYTINEIIKKLSEEVKNEQLLNQVSDLLKDVDNIYELIKLNNDDLEAFKNNIKVSLYDLIMCNNETDKMLYMSRINEDLNHLIPINNLLEKHDQDIPF